ncbi:hypothetical protein VHEMI04403 [[Torrubiella] hemipterigena]|uniref:Arylsulfatase n=1 Tax=[Torrubiella] hemipterigena TaxID=1531966 RepID=A0A0A1SV59_9HYPO|nr:hypothetical protein VHEMI04403 [[Torrubiella] hemipterigena]
MLMKVTTILAVCASGAIARNVQQQQVLLNSVDGSSQVGGASGNGDVKRPNVVMILTDDQDMHMQSLDYMPLLKKHMTDRGTFYKRHFCTTAVCCPARVSLWTGRTAHNTNVTDVNPPHGGYPKFISQGLNENYLPVWLQDAGYNTYYTGKLFNAHTTDNYNAPHAAGWNGSDFLLDPFTYSYLNSTYQRNKEPPVSYEGHHTADVLAKKAMGFLDEAASNSAPFFLGLSPVAPHCNVWENTTGDHSTEKYKPLFFTPPIPADRHKHLFKTVKVPRTHNFNPENPSGVSWMAKLPKIEDGDVDAYDEFYRARLRTLQSVDELVQDVVHRLEELNILDNTYIIYTTDNGFHIGQHRLQPGKDCGIEEDINIPLIIRGPGVPEGHTTEIVTTHTDMAPTIMGLIGEAAPANARFDGTAIPLTSSGIVDAAKHRQEHVNVEYWGIAVGEGGRLGDDCVFQNNTYKALRVVSPSWNLYYSVWCTNEHELYDMKNDPGQLNNLLSTTKRESPVASLNGHALDKVVARLDALLFVLKSCKEETCVRPWHSLHPQGNVENLNDALSAKFDAFYTEQQVKVAFNRCELAHILEAEGPQFEKDGLFYRQGHKWSEWT